MVQRRDLRHEGERDEEMMELRRKLGAMVKAGKMSREEAKEEFEAFMRKRRGDGDRGDRIVRVLRDRGDEELFAGTKLFEAGLSGEELERALEVLEAGVEAVAAGKDGARTFEWMHAKLEGLEERRGMSS